MMSLRGPGCRHNVAGYVHITYRVTSLSATKDCVMLCAFYDPVMVSTVARRRDRFQKGVQNAHVHT